MPAPLISRDEVVARIAHVFKSRGYEGASLANLSEKTGLVKASLYHYFPDGKRAMAEAALGAFGASMKAHAIEPLMTNDPPRQRLLAMLEGMDRVYDHGQDSCLFSLLSMGEAREMFQALIVANVSALAQALVATLHEAGVPIDQAPARAEAMIVELEGALIVARVLNDSGVFARTLDRLRAALP